MPRIDYDHHYSPLTGTIIREIRLLSDDGRVVLAELDTADGNGGFCVRAYNPDDDRPQAPTTDELRIVFETMFHGED